MQTESEGVNSRGTQGAGAYPMWNKDTGGEGGAEKTRWVPIRNVKSWAGNPRQDFDPEGLIELSDSLKEYGMLSPVVVRPILCGEESEGECYQIVAGERRWRAALMAQWTQIQVIVKELDDLAALKIAIVENDQRRDVNPIERARGYQRLTEAGMGQIELAAELKRSQPFVSESLRLLKLPESVQAHVGSKALAPSAATLLLKYSDDPAALAVIAQIVMEHKIPVAVLEKGMPHQVTSALAKAGLARKIESYQVKFDVKICDACPFGAMRRDSYGDRVCFRPDHAAELQKAALDALKVKETESREAVKAFLGETAKVTKLSSLGYNAYEKVGKTPPQGCGENCQCRSAALNSEREMVVICLDPQRYRKLAVEQAKRDEADRAATGTRRYESLKQRAKALCASDLPGFAATVLAYELANLLDAAYNERAAFAVAHGFGWNMAETFGHEVKATARRQALRDLRARGADWLLLQLAVVRSAKEIAQWAGSPDYHKTSFTDWFEEYDGGKADAPAAAVAELVSVLDQAAARSEDADEEDEMDSTDGPKEPVCCLKCKREIDESLLNVVVAESEVFTGGNEERTLEWLESGCIVITQPMTPDNFEEPLPAYCPTCAPNASWCDMCGRTDEILEPDEFIESGALRRVCSVCRQIGPATAEIREAAHAG